MLRAVTHGKIRVVFGCAGQRDRAKRAPMVRVAQETADHVYATSDNPRTEAIEQIFADMQAGVMTPAAITWIADRRAAIARAIADCQPGDTLVIAGKGHETVQECADTVFPFDDRQVARELLVARMQPT
jgi:UDP-N-acetylmuramoyl-L-alanyl-D-glutamate--2,6-diaminopimelate ligase